MCSAVVLHLLVSRVGVGIGSLVVVRYSWHFYVFSSEINSLFDNLYFIDFPNIFILNLMF